jgi:hypothetical protein
VTRNLDSFAAQYFKDWRAVSDQLSAERQPPDRKRGRTPPWEQLFDLVWTQPEEAWTLILALVERAPSDEALSFVAAGPIEDFLGHHGAEWASRVAAEAESNDRFRDSLNYVWGWNSFPDSVWLEVLPHLDPEVRAHWKALKSVGQSGRASGYDVVGTKARQPRWRAPSARPKSQRFT